MPTSTPARSLADQALRVKESLDLVEAAQTATAWRTQRLHNDLYDLINWYGAAAGMTLDQMTAAGGGPKPNAT